jgi:hypothetical protein
MLRIYELPKEDQDLVYNITLATNSQNPVSLRDLKSNDEKQRLLEQSMNELGYKYRRQRSDAPLETNEYEVETVAAAVLVVWRRQRKPPTVQSVLDEFYEKVFTADLNGAQAVTAVRILNLASDCRRRQIRKLDNQERAKLLKDNTNKPEEGTLLLSTFGYFTHDWHSPDTESIASEMGKQLLSNLKIDLVKLNHVTFKMADEYLNESGQDLFDKSFETMRDEKERSSGNIWRDELKFVIHRSLQ